FPGIADRNAFGLKPSLPPASPAEPPAPPLVARIELPKEVSEKPVGVGPGAGGGAERSVMERRYGLARGAGAATARGGVEIPALKSEIADLTPAPSVAATTPSASSSPGN